MKMADCQEFCLRWNNFQSNITHQFETLRDDEDFVDVTLTTGGECIKAHKVVLSACSPYFKELLKNNPCKHPIIFMRDVEFAHLKALVAFMYAGVVNVEQAELATFLRTAEALHILGLTEAPQLHRDIKNFPSECKSGSGASETNATSPPSGNAAAALSGSKEEGEEAGRTSPSESPSKRQKTSTSSSGTDQNGSRGWSGGGSGGGSAGETEENVQPGSIVPASDLFQPTRGGLTITPAEPSDNDLEQSYNEDLADMLEPKTELPDYSSDGESRTDAGSYMDNSADVHGFGTMNDIMSATSSQGATGQDGQPMESYQEWEAVEVQDIPGVTVSFPWWKQRGGPGRRRSSNLTGECGPLGPMVTLGPGVEVPTAQLEALKWTDFRKLTRGLAGLIFTPYELATCSVTGQRWSRAASYGQGAANRRVKPALGSDKVKAIIEYVRNAFPDVAASRIKQVLAYKCQEASVTLKMKAGVFSVGGAAQVQILDHAQRLKTKAGVFNAAQVQNLETAHRSEQISRQIRQSPVQRAPPKPEGRHNTAASAQSRD